jgi:hypothetical protein
MRRIILVAALAALCLSLVVPATAAAVPPAPTMDITACRASSDTVRVGVSWSHLAVTGGEIFINTAPLESKYGVAWNQRGKNGRHSEDIFINGDIVDIVTVNLYNDKDPNNITFEQRVIGDGNNAEEILPC